MHNNRRTRLVLGVLLIIAITLITLDFRDGGASPARSLGADIFGPIEQVTHDVTDPVASLFDSITGGPSAQGTIATLQRQNAELRAELSAAQLSKTARKQLAQLLQLDAGGYRIVTANVIAAGGSFSDTVTLDAGSNDGIKPDETVLNGWGFVGTVTQVSADTSTVLLANDASSVAGVQLAGGGEIGAVTGTGKSTSGSALLRLNLFDANAVLHTGQQVVTYASVGDQPEVPGVPVGTIVSVSSSAGGLTQTAMVRPAVNFTALGVVGVVVQVPRHNPRVSVLPRPVPTVTITTTPSPPGTPSPASSATATPPRPRPRLPRAATEVRGLISFALVAVTVVFQLTVVDRIAFPGGAGPDLVLLLVAALALAGGPLAGVLIGFLAGLALDVAPPGSHLVGQNALVFCLVGYACGLLADDSSGDVEQGHTALFEIVVTAAGAICGEALAALLGVMLSDPRVTWPAITHVLPVAVAYDVLLCPFVLYAAAAALRLAGARREGRRVGWSASQARMPVPGANQGAIRQLAGGSGPRLRLSERDKGPGSIGGLRGPVAGRPAGPA